MTTFWEIAALSVDHMFLCILTIVILVMSRFGFEGWIWVLIASELLIVLLLRPTLSFSKLFLNIVITCPCNVYPLTPHFYIVKLGFTGEYILFLFLP